MGYREILLVLFSLIGASAANGQDSVSEEDAFFIKKIYDHTLQSGPCYNWLTHLTENIGARLSGSDAYNQAVGYTAGLLSQMELDSVYTQRCTVDYWERGRDQVIIQIPGMKDRELHVLALGRSYGTGVPLTGEVVEIKSLEEVENMPNGSLDGKIAFFNRPMDPTKIRTFNAYGGAVDQRVYGASTASAKGAIASLVRSMTTRIDTVPHTGTMLYKDGDRKIPGIAISTVDADWLSDQLSEGTTRATVISNSKPTGPKPSFNVIAEIKGSEFPDEIILVGGHLDSWDVGGGAHDDGSGCVHAMQVIESFKALNYQPKRTIRCVLFANEENGLAGALKYAEESNAKNEFHLAAMESDAGGFSPRGFAVDGDPSILQPFAKQISDWIETYLSPYGLMMSTGGSGADISPLKSQKGILIGLRPDSQRYFDYHHTHRDKIEAVNPRELQLGAASMASLIYLIDKYGLTK